MPPQNPTATSSSGTNSRHNASSSLYATNSNSNSLNSPLYVNPYNPSLTMALVLAPLSHITRFYLESLTAIHIFQSRLNEKMPLTTTNFVIQWHILRTIRYGGTFITAFLSQLVEDQIVDYFKANNWTWGSWFGSSPSLENNASSRDASQQQQNPSHQLDSALETDQAETNPYGEITYSLIIVSTIFDHFTLAYTLRRLFFNDTSRLLVYNGFLTHLGIETVYRVSSKYVTRLFESFAREDTKAEEADSNSMWEVVRELTSEDTYTQYGQEYVLRHYRDSSVSESPFRYTIRLGLAYYVQFYYLLKKCGIFGRVKAMAKILLVDVLISFATYPLSVVKFSQIKHAGEETFWESSAITHARSIQKNEGWSGFYKGFSSYLVDAALRVISPAIVWGLTDWAVFTLYKWMHPRSGLPTDNPLWQASSEASASGSATIINALNQNRLQGEESNIDINDLIEKETGISHEPIGEADTCCVCMEKQRSIVLSPCNHLACCQMCSIQVDRCPLCRKNIEKTTRIYW